jgi:phage-related protein
LNTHRPSPRWTTPVSPSTSTLLAKRNYKTLPEDVQADAGYNLDLVQQGKAPEVSFGPLHSLGSGTMELRIDEATDTYRVVYVAKFSGAVFVLDAFKKKSPTGAVGFRRTSSRGFDSGTSKPRG